MRVLIREFPTSSSQGRSIRRRASFANTASNYWFNDLKRRGFIVDQNAVCASRFAQRCEVYVYAPWEVLPVDGPIVDGACVAERCPGICEVGLTGMGLVNGSFEEGQFLIRERCFSFVACYMLR